jgi:hypothetical protein
MLKLCVLCVSAVKFKIVIRGKYEKKSINLKFNL